MPPPVPPPVRFAVPRWGKLLVVGLVGLWFIALDVAAVLGPPSANHPTPTQSLEASLRLGALSVQVTNGDHQDWTNVRVRLSDKFFCLATDKIEASKSALVYLASCTSFSGERFTPATMAPTNVVVTAILAEDAREAIAGFTPFR